MRAKPHIVSRSHKMRFGAEPRNGGTRFKLWAPKAKSVGVRIKGKRTLLQLENVDNGWHRLDADGVKAGSLYKYVLPDGTEIPDPASRYQPDGLDGFSAVVDPSSFTWTDTQWTGRPWEEAIIYELHIGTFTREGTFRAAIDKLDHLAELGITAIQIMPLAQSYGRFNWGYDGALWFAPNRSFGAPDDLKALVDAAHARSIMVFLDVVYNHFGPYGNYLPTIAPIFTSKHDSPWGESINFDGAGAATVRELVIESTLYWITEFNLDGLRFDAVHTMEDDSSSHILELISARIRAARPRQYTHLILENSDNQELWLRRTSGGDPVHYDAQWNDDLHHLLHAAATGEDTGYYSDFDNLEERSDRLARALAEGFVYQGELKPHEGMKRGEPSVGLPATAFVVYIQNHDQVGNRILGDRITNLAHPNAIKAIAALYLLSPQIPMLFMGEEWASNSPFPFFSDVPPEARADLRKGRQKQLENAPEHADPTKPSVEDTVDPTALATFTSAKLDWQARTKEPHRTWLEYYRTLIDVRKMEIIPRLFGLQGFAAQSEVLAPRTVMVRWTMGDGSELRLYANLDDEAYDGGTEIIGRRLFLHGHIDETSLGPWTILWTVTI